ncbi:MAG: hypothetical protein HUJ77_00675 [Clostridium sp.]|uniref:hypothetical protein n=1 Tax=Clostridium sp. TaxID=1506 RepID=UPI0025B9DC15|nr:hypothetical protein [Clostridium sp.]MCF0146890.1 hypothetical protein [Clostridium sp.]
MEFEYKPSDYRISFREYFRYLNTTSPVITLYLKTILAPYLILAFSLITYILSEDYRYLPYLIPFIIVFSALLLLLFLLIIKLRRKRAIKNTKLFCDIESTFYFTIEDGYLIRENEFSSMKIKLSEIDNIILLKHGLILSVKNSKVSPFIPKTALPISLEEFLALLINENNSLIVKDEFKRLKNRNKKLYAIFIFTILLSFISSFFIGKYNFTRYPLIPNNDLIKQNDDTYLYENEDIGISINFPSNWEDKFGIEEKPDRINVYYLVDGKQSHDTTLLFSIRGLGAIFDNLTLNVIKTEGLYLFIGPTKINLINGSKEHLEYMDLYKDIEKLKIIENDYYHI